MRYDISVGHSRWRFSLLLLAAAILAACGGPAATGSTGQQAPAFTLRQFGGDELRLDQLRDRTTVVNFWATWCIPCREEMPLFEEVWRAQRDQGVTFVGVAIQDDEFSLKSFVQTLNITYPTGLDHDSSIALSYQVVGLPTTVFVSPSGRLVRKWQGPIDRERLLSFIAEARGA